MGSSGVVTSCPPSWARREQRLQVIQAAKARLEARQRAQDAQDGRRVDDRR